MNDATQPSPLETNDHRVATLITVLRDGNLGSVKTAIAAIGKNALNMALDENNNTAIHLVSKNGSNNTREIIQHLVKDIKFDINITNSSGDTALHVAVRDQNLEAVKALLVLGAARNIQNQQGKTPLDIAQGISNSAREEKSTVKQHIIRLLSNVEVLSPPRTFNGTENTSKHNDEQPTLIDYISEFISEYSDAMLIAAVLLLIGSIVAVASEALAVAGPLFVFGITLAVGAIIIGDKPEHTNYSANNKQQGRDNTPGFTLLGGSATKAEHRDPHKSYSP
jgi:hypothetical protein